MRLVGVSIFAAGALLLAACEKDESSSTEGATEAEEGTEASQSGVMQGGRRVAKYFEYESGMVEYALSGTRSGTEVLYWDDWGERQSRCTKANITVMGMTQTTDDCVISLPDVVYTIDMKTKTAMRAANPAKTFAEGLSDEELKEFGRRMSESMGMKKVGTDTVAGYSCDLWRTDTLQSETCSHKGIPLRTKTNMMGMAMAVTATKVDFDTDVDDSRFEVPSDVTVSEAPAIPQEALDAMRKGMTAPEGEE
jgi:hypothetical protein